MPTSTLSPGKAAIVVGSGLAGLSAASELIARGIPVHLLERSPKPGGNSIKASSGINGAPTKYQPGPPFSDSSFYGDTVVSAGAVLARASDGERKRREKLVARLTNESAGVIEWLNGKGVDLSVVVELGGHSFPRTHRGRKITPGWAIVSALLSELKSSPLFHLETSAVVTQMLTSGSRVEGVEYIVESSQVVEDAEYILKSGVVVQGVDYKYAGERIEKKVLKGPVIFASGGFAGDAHGMLAQYRPDLAGFPSTNEARPGSQPLLAEIGAQLVDMEQVQVHPTSFIDPKDPLNPVKFLAAELLRGEGGLLLHDGKRFVNEMENRKVVTDAIVGLSVAELAPMQWNVQLVLDEGVYANASSHVDFYIFKGLVKKTTLSELGSEAWKTIAEYSLVAAGEGSDVFGRKYFGHWELQPEVAAGESVVYVGTITPAVHFTMGGVLINEKSEVLRGNGVKIEAVWAAGEVAGGVHGGNRLGGSSLLECCVFGRTAGVEAAKFLQRDDEV